LSEIRGEERSSFRVLYAMRDALDLTDIFRREQEREAKDRIAAEVVERVIQKLNLERVMYETIKELGLEEQFEKDSESTHREVSNPALKSRTGAVLNCSPDSSAGQLDNDYEESIYTLAAQYSSDRWAFGDSAPVFRLDLRS
jgi:hypothetical protein